MSERQLDIADMQCWVFRMAQSRWNMSAADCSELFKKYDILGFISECYDSLHLNSYACVVDAIELLRFTQFRIYDALFDFDTEIWKEGPDYLVSLYDQCASGK